MNRYINALFTKHKKKHLPSFLQGTWFDEWMSYGYITFITSFIFQGMLYANWRDNVVKTSMDVAITLSFSFIMPWWIGLIIAHTVNYCINGQAICVFYHPEQAFSCLLLSSNQVQPWTHEGKTCSHGLKKCASAWK